MAQYKKGTRYYNARKGTFRGNAVIFEPQWKFDSIAGYYKIPVREEYRPDLISLSVYNRSDLGWVIMKANNFDHISQLKVGTTIAIPNISGIL